jgi:methionyl-tRNA formyltransferase
VVTSADKPAGRGRKIKTSPVKDYALKNDLRVLQPAKLKDPEFLKELHSIHPDLIVVVAFRMLPEEVWGVPPLGTINLHASLRPQYRGAAPINWAIMNGEKETGVTTFFIEKDIDTGKIILQKSTPIDEEDDAGHLHDRLMSLGADLLVETIHRISHGDLSVTSQSDLVEKAGALKSAPRIFPEDCRIDWDRPVSRVYDHIRGLSPYPAAWTNLVSGGQSKVLKIYSAGKEELVPGDPPGSVTIENGRRLLIACRDGYIHIKSLQMEGKKRMPAENFLRGIQDPSSLGTD